MPPQPGVVVGGRVRRPWLPRQRLERVSRFAVIGDWRHGRHTGPENGSIAGIGSCPYAGAVQIEFTVQTWREGNQFIAHAMPLDVASAGDSPAAARAALDEAVRLFLKTAADHGSLGEVLEEAGYAADGSAWRSPAWIGIERAFATVCA